VGCLIISQIAALRHAEAPESMPPRLSSMPLQRDSFPAAYVPKASQEDAAAKDTPFLLI
jgi:hypothetical protein